MFLIEKKQDITSPKLRIISGLANQVLLQKLFLWISCL